MWDDIAGVPGVKVSVTTGTAGTALRQLAIKCEGQTSGCAVEAIEYDTVAALCAKTSRLAGANSQLDTAGEKAQANEANKNGIAILKSGAKAASVVGMMLEAGGIANIQSVLVEHDPTMARLATGVLSAMVQTLSIEGADANLGTKCTAQLEAGQVCAAVTQALLSVTSGDTGADSIEYTMSRAYASPEAAIASFIEADDDGSGLVDLEELLGFLPDGTNIEDARALMIQVRLHSFAPSVSSSFVRMGTSTIIVEGSSFVPARAPSTLVGSVAGSLLFCSIPFPSAPRAPAYSYPGTVRRRREPPARPG